MDESAVKTNNRLKLLEYLGDPDNEWLARKELSTAVLGYKQENGIYKCFTVDELCQIDAEALEIRRKRYASRLARVDAGMLREARKNPQAAKLMYQRLENWSEKTRTEHSVTPEVLKAILEGLPEDYRVRVMASLKIGGE